jgi:hypothetical protein
MDFSSQLRSSAIRAWFGFAKLPKALRFGAPWE